MVWMGCWRVLRNERNQSFGRFLWAWVCVGPPWAEEAYEGEHSQESWGNKNHKLELTWAPPKAKTEQWNWRTGYPMVPRQWVCSQIYLAVLSSIHLSIHPIIQQICVGFLHLPYAYMLDPGTVLLKKTAKHVFQHTLPVTFLGAQMIKALPEMRETRVRSLGRKDPLEKEMATHSNIFVWRIPWTEEPGVLQSMGSQRFGHNWVT